MDEIVAAIREMSQGSLQNDKALLHLCNTLTERLTQVVTLVGLTNARVKQLEQEVKELQERLDQFVLTHAASEGGVH